MEQVGSEIERKRYIKLVRFWVNKRGQAWQGLMVLMRISMFLPQSCGSSQVVKTYLESADTIIDLLLGDQH